MDGALKTVNIWEEAVKEKNKEIVSLSQEKILMVVGNSSVGKTSFLKVVKNEAESQVKPTYLLDYSYIRKGHQRKQLIHCYEIATKTQSEIIPSLFTKDNFANVTIAICIDLSKPSTIIDEVNEWMNIIRKEVGNSIHEKIGMQERYDEYLARRKEENASHEDYKAINIAPLNIVIIGCKYDLYEKYETENRKWLSRTMRYLAHVNNSNLLFCSSKVSTIGIQMRANLMDLMFEEKTKIISQRDHLKPIFIARNQDNLNHIGVPTSGSLSGLEVLKRQLIGLFGADEQKKRQGIDISKYYESKIQSLLETRKKQLAKISKGLNKKNLL